MSQAAAHVRNPHMSATNHSVATTTKAEASGNTPGNAACSDASTSGAKPDTLRHAHETDVPTQGAEPAGPPFKQQQGKPLEGSSEAHASAAVPILHSGSASVIDSSPPQQFASNPSNTTAQAPEPLAYTSENPDLTDSPLQPQQANGLDMPDNVTDTAPVQATHVNFDPKQDSEGRWLPPGYHRHKPEAGLPECYSHYDDAGIEQTSEDSPVMAGEILDRDEFDREMSEDFKRMVTIEGRSYYVQPADLRGCGRTWCSPRGPDPALLTKIASQYQWRYDKYDRRSERSAKERDECAEWHTCLLDAFRITDHDSIEARKCFKLASLFADKARKETPGYPFVNTDPWAWYRQGLPAVRDGFINEHPGLIDYHFGRRDPMDYNYLWTTLLQDLEVVAFRSGDESEDPKSRFLFKVHTLSHHFVDWLQDLKQAIPDTERPWLLTLCLPSHFWTVSTTSRMMILITAVVTLGLDIGVFDALLRRFGLQQETDLDWERSLSPNVLVLDWMDGFTMITWPRHLHSLPCVRVLSSISKTDYRATFPMPRLRYHVPQGSCRQGLEAVYHVAWRHLRMSWCSTAARTMRQKLLKSKYHEVPGENESGTWADLWSSVMDLKRIGVDLEAWIISSHEDLSLDIEVCPGNKPEQLDQRTFPSPLCFWHQAFENQLALALQEAALCSEVLAMHNDRLNRQAAEKSLEAAQLSINEAHMIGKLTVLAYIFLPITLVTGIFGMNITPFAGDGGAPVWQFWAVAPSIVIPAWLFGLFTLRKELGGWARPIQRYWSTLFSDHSKDAIDPLNVQRPPRIYRERKPRGQVVRRKIYDSFVGSMAYLRRGFN